MSNPTQELQKLQAINSQLLVNIGKARVQLREAVAGLDADEESPLAMGVRELSVILDESSKLADVVLCTDRNHVGLDKVMMGGRLPDESLGQDAAFFAHMLGTYEQRIEDAKDKLEQHKDDPEFAASIYSILAGKEYEARTVK